MEGQLTDLIGYQKNREAKRKGNIQRGVRNTAVLALRLSKPEFVTITSSDFDRLAIDRSYQREEIKPQVARIITVLRAGGQIADPITVVRRLFKENGSAAASSKLWIVDGQQRMWAALECGATLHALIYEVRSGEEERALFVALNNKTTVHANTFMHAHPGPSGEFLRTINREGHVAADRISFKSGGDLGRLSASTILGGISKLYGCRAGSTAATCDSLDPKIVLNQDKARVYVDLLCQVFENNPGYHIVMGFAYACVERWRGDDPFLPSTRQIASMKKTKWATIVANSSIDTQMLIARRVLKMWQ